MFRRQLSFMRTHVTNLRYQAEAAGRGMAPHSYTSYEDTKRYIESNRRKPLEMWEALMRVDPSLSVKEAKRLARKKHAI